MSASAAISAALGRVASIEKLRAKPAGMAQPALFAAVRDDKGFVVEPQSAVLLQHLARRLDVARVALHVRQAVVLDLRHVDRRVPGGEQRGGADRGGGGRNLRRQR